MATVLFAAAVGAWIFAFKMRAFLGLATTSDLYSFVQMSTSWLHGQWLHDNCYGNALAFHTYLLAPLLGIVAYPFGAPGLLFVAALAAALSVIALVEILRLLGAPFRAALAFATLAVIMPLSVHVYQDALYGFHVELLEPVLVLWLTYFLLRRRWTGSLVTAVTLLLIKEDTPLIVAAVGAIVLTEDLVRAGAAAARRRGWNYPALAVAVLAVLALPVLLHVLKTQQGPGAPANLDRLKPVTGASLTSNGALLSYVISQAGTWLRAPTVALWLKISVAATFGLIVLRPHLLVFGVVTTLISWLMQDSLVWAPRFVQALAFFQIAGCLAFASACRLVDDLRRRGGWGGWVAAVFVGALGVGAAHGCWRQLQTVAGAREVYRLSPHLTVKPAERAEADRLFARYRRESRRDEPVIATDYLFRYAHDRNLFWYTRLRDAPRPVWILWDQQAQPLATLWVFLKTDVGIDLSAYELVAREGRFLLYYYSAGAKPARTLLPAFPTITGAPYGTISMRVRFPTDRAGHTEPLLALGPTGDGDLFFVHYLNAHQLQLGMESMGAAAHFSPPLSYVPQQTYRLALFSGSLLPPRSEQPAGAESEALRRYRQYLVSISIDGQAVLDTLAPPHTVHPDEVVAGCNLVRAGSAEMSFTGAITDVRRGGYPVAVPTMDEIGPVRLTSLLLPVGSGAPEPLVVVGVPGDAELGYIRVLPENRIKLGVEIWGTGAYESDVLSIEGAKPLTVTFYLPALYPPPGDRRWGEIPLAMQLKARTQIGIMLNGATVLERPVPAPRREQSAVYYGKNPVGGSWVGPAFSGRILQVTRLPLAEADDARKK